MNRLLHTVPAILLSCLAACQPIRRAEPSATANVDLTSLMQGEFDNHEQVWQAQQAAQTGQLPMPHALFALEPLSAKDRVAKWFLWRVRLDAAKPFEAEWALRAGASANDAIVLTPYRRLNTEPKSVTAKNFDPKQWAALDACALRGKAVAGGFRVEADPAACATIAPGIGPQAALLPIAVERTGEWLRVRLYADQARGATAQENARRVRWFTGWAAINGAGPKATTGSSDWHMNRDLRLGSEGGRIELHWRDGTPSGWSIELERVTYRESATPVLKLSVIDDAGGQVQTYAWANPDATRIGLNLGWLQIGLEQAGTVASDAGR